MAGKQKVDDLVLEYETICNKLVQAFAKKQCLDLGFWIGDAVGGMADFNGAFTFNMDDILLDLKSKAEKWEILSWQNASVENYPQVINYNSWLMGLRFKDLKNK